MPYEVKPRCIIAMKGLPFTGKTECATLIAASLKCPVFSLDDFLDDLRPTPLQTPSSSPHPRDLALQIICRISKSHLSRGLVDNIVIDSPLSSRSHLDHLIELASYIPKTRLVIIECKPNNVYMWQNKFEEYAEANSESLAGKWYKPKDWDDVVNDINNDYDERSDGYEVSKLVFDPLSGYKMELCSRIYFSLLTGLPVLYSPPFMEAISYMITRDESEGPDLVVYDEWRRPNYTEGICIGDSHSITNYTEEIGLENEEAKYCTVCEQHITGAAYTCTACSLALHKECVESSSPLQLPRVTWDKLGSDCDSCKVHKRRGVPFDCPTCEFKRQLKRRAYDGVPSVVRHECDEHLLWVDTSSWINIVKCMACGDEEAGYMYSCKVCGVVYHGTCLTEVARQVKHVHGQHHHRMLLKFSSHEGEEDYMCQECLEKRDPQLWFYSCEECPYETHLACSLEGMERDEEKSELEEQDGEGESSESVKLEPTEQSKCGDDNHKWTTVNEEEREYELNCMECGVEVKGAAYMCTDCNIPIHKDCVIPYLREHYS